MPMNFLLLLSIVFLAVWSHAAAAVHKNLAYVKDGHERQTLDLYLPEKSNVSTPLIIWIHGGAWQGGSKEGALPLRQGWLDQGYAIASINYRLSGHAVFPAQIQDCKAAIRWLRAHAAQYRLDPQRFGVWGSSAGGHLAALVGTSGDEKTLDVGENLDQSSRVQAVCDYYGPTDFHAFVTRPGYENHANPSSPESLLLGGTVQEKPELAKAANPIPYITPDDPPFLVVHGNQDTVVPLQQSELLFQALKSANRSVRFHTIEGAGHGPGFNGPEILPMVQEFFALHLAKQKNAVKPVAISTSSKASGSSNEMGALPTFEQILARHDQNRDGKISREEFRGPQGMFVRFDSNKDGFVTRDEHPGKTASLPASPQPPATAPAHGLVLTGDTWIWRDGDFVMNGILMKPAGKGPFPAVLISHGMGGSAGSFGRQKARMLVEQGFVCIAPDYTHTRAAPGDAATSAGARPENIRRAKTCLDLLTKMPEVDAKRLFAYGHSMGGFVTIALAADQPDRLKAVAITGSGITPQEGMAAPSKTTAAKVRTPFLIFHGANDSVVRPEQSAALVEILAQQHVPHERIVFPGEGHPIDQTQAQKVFPAIADWFRKHANASAEK